MYDGNVIVRADSVGYTKLKIRIGFDRNKDYSM